MYSGTTLTRASGRIMGAHQKFDRVARRHLKLLLLEQDTTFPSIREILKFEGRNGPDGIKRKSPAQNEPLHFVDPFDESDNELHRTIIEHYQQLIVALKCKSETKAAFEAAWLAHAIVDGLTPAHHYPYHAELKKLRGGVECKAGDTVMQKLIIPGTKPGEQVKKNWQMWGPKGLMSTHGFFELGVASIVAPLKLKRAFPDEKALRELQDKGVVVLFRQTAKEIGAMDLYVNYYKTGWTPKLARQIRRNLAPLMVQMITLAWYSAAMEAKGQAK